MAVEIRQFTAVIPPGTTAAAPFVLDMTFPPRVVDSVEIIVPQGSSGVVGFAIANSGVRMIPYQSDLWIVTAGEKIAWPLQGFINSGSWQLLGYNTGANAHAVYVRFLLSLTNALPQAAQSTRLADIDLSSGDGADVATDTEGVLIT